MTEYIIFLSISALTTFTPGPAVLLAARNGAIYGFRRSCAGILGNTLALVLVSTISALGLSAIILTSATIFFIVKVIGSGYLIYLGVNLWLTKSSPLTVEENEIKLIDRTNLSISREAFFVGLSNPKALAFFTALLPQFINTSEPFVGQFFTLIIGFLTCSVSALSCYAGLFSKLNLRFKNSEAKKWINKVTGAFFITFGVAMLKIDR